jgi:membrane protein involved in colicin uptake
MKNVIVSIATVAILGVGIAPATLAQKPEGAGGGKDVMKSEASAVREAEQQREKKLIREMEHRKEMSEQQRRLRDPDRDGYESRREPDEEMTKNMERQREMKAEQERKELGKGSEQGQDMRQEHSRKWWRFWD